MTDLLDILADIDPQPSPTWDVQRGYRPRYERCPDCGSMAYRPIYGNPKLRSTLVDGYGWLTLNECACGRYQWADWKDNQTQEHTDAHRGVLTAS